MTSNAPLFDTYLIVDWSAANTPKRGKDSIWIAEARRSARSVRVKAPVNPATRSEAMALLTDLIRRDIDRGKRVFAGFDFPFGYPAGAAAMIAGRPGWEALWEALAASIQDGDDNTSNRYALADAWNATKFTKPLFWGRPHQHVYDSLSAKKPTTAAFRDIEFRIVEGWQPPAKSVWQLAYNGAVGSQALLGIARLENLRRTFEKDAAVWPFETMWNAKLDAPVIIAEVYPSMFEPRYEPGDVKDEAQVRTVATVFARSDANGALRKLLAKPDGLPLADARRVIAEEGWIVGAGHSKDPAP